MIRIATLFRRASFPGLEAVRGPKKKKEAEAKIESTDIVNIFKDRPDPQIKHIREYPIYVQQLSRGTFSIHEYYQGVQTDNKFYMPGRATLRGFMNAWKRQKVKAMNQFKHMDRNPNIMAQNDIVHRRTVYNVGRLGKDEEAAKRKLEEAEQQAAMDEDDE